MYGLILKGMKDLILNNKKESGVVSAIAATGLYNLYKTDYELTKEEIENILNKSKKITTKEDVLNEINLKKIDKGIPIPLVIDNGEHALGSYAVINGTLRTNKKDKHEIGFISKILEPYPLENKKNILKEHNIEFTDEKDIIEKFNVLKNEKEFNIYETLDEISKKYINNPIFVNMSYVYNFFNQETKKETNFYLNGDRSNLLFKRETIDKINLIKEENFKLIKTLYDNPNLHISKSAGNNIRHSGVLAKDIFYELIMTCVDYDFNKYQDLKNLLLDLIKKNENFSDIVLFNFKEEFKKITNIYLSDEQLETFISLSLLDYLINYESMNLVEQLEFLKENNIDLSNQIIVAQAISYKTLSTNFNDLKKQLNLNDNKYESIKENLFKDFYKNNILESNSLSDICKYQEKINTLNKTHDIILDNTTYGNILNPYNKSSFYKIGVINQDLKDVSIYDGTSSASPQLQSFQILEKFENKEFKNYKVQHKEKPLNYDFINKDIINNDIEKNIEINQLNMK